MIVGTAIIITVVSVILVIWLLGQSVHTVRRPAEA
jgi:hypothetical protein